MSKRKKYTITKTDIKRMLASAAFDPKNHIVAEEAPVSYCLMRIRELSGEAPTIENMTRIMQLAVLAVIKENHNQEQFNESCTDTGHTGSQDTTGDHLFPAR